MGARGVVERFTMPKCRRTRAVVSGIKDAIYAKTVRIIKRLRNWTVRLAAITQVRSTARHAMVHCLAQRDTDLAGELEH